MYDPRCEACEKFDDGENCERCRENAIASIESRMLSDIEEKAKKEKTSVSRQINSVIQNGKRRERRQQEKIEKYRNYIEDHKKVQETVIDILNNKKGYE